METLESILEKVIDPNRDEQPLDVTRSSEVGNRNKSKVLKNHHVSNVIGNMDDSMVIRRQSNQNKINFFCYTSQLELKNEEKALEDESWTIVLWEKLNQFVGNDMWYLVLRPKDN